MRILVFVIGGLETAAMLFLLGMLLISGQLWSGEQLSRYIGWALLRIYGLPYLACVVPALILAALNRWLPLALALCILAVPLAFISLRTA